MFLPVCEYQKTTDRRGASELHRLKEERVGHEHRDPSKRRNEVSHWWDRYLAENAISANHAASSRLTIRRLADFARMSSEPSRATDSGLDGRQMSNAAPQRHQII